MRYPEKYSSTMDSRRTLWSPLSELRREIDGLFDDFWASPTPSQWRPAYEVEEEEDHYLLTLEMPGVPKDQIKIELVGNQLTVAGERRRETKDKNGFSERQYGSFHRSFMLPNGIDFGKVEADCQDGVLKIYVPKAESAKPRQVRIGEGSETGFFGRLLGQTPKKEREEVRSSHGAATNGANDRNSKVA